ncbi:MAG: site-specific DNA-methyltransferase [Anaerolineales bacterium]|jgi:site-specific DNA-methyltransferase (adenine-specific)|nr:site-specific DNA-methyltransferase [Anaerolineales bacterium]
MTVLQGNCQEILGTLSQESVDLVYLDPPFFTQKTHSLSTRDNLTEFSFEDKWSSLKKYLAFMEGVLSQCQKVLKNTGSIFLHCDKSASHHLRVLLDKVFGEENFQSEIIWSYKRWSNSKKGLLNSHQTIYFYSKTDNFKFNTIYTDYSPTTNIDQILQARARNGNGKVAYLRDEEGNVVLGEKKRGVPLLDVWSIPFLNPKAKERTGYPTQKPILLLERIIEISTEKGDCVLDPFCGSGTTLVSAKLLGRQYIGIDISKDAVELSNQRLVELTKSESQLLVIGEEGYLAKSDYERAILKAIDAVPVERNSGIDGFLKVYVDSYPVSVKIQKKGESIEISKRKLINASKTKNCKLMILVKTQKESDNALFSWNDENVLVIDSYDLQIKNWIDEQNEKAKSLATSSLES